VQTNNLQAEKQFMGVFPMEKFNQIHGVAALNNAEMEMVHGGSDTAYYLGYAAGSVVKAAGDFLSGLFFDSRRIWH